MAIVDYFGTEILPGDRITKECGWSWRKGHRDWFYVISVEKNTIHACRIFFHGQLNNGSFRRGFTRLGEIRKHTFILESMIQVDHKWRARRNVGQIDSCCRLGGRRVP